MWRGIRGLLGADEECLKAPRREGVDPKIAEHTGRIVKTTADGMLVEFASVVDAVRCAVEVQQALPERNRGFTAESRMELRAGSDLAEVNRRGRRPLRRRRQHRRFATDRERPN